MDLKVVLFIPKGKFIEFIVIYSWVFERLQHLILATFWDISTLLPITFTSESLYFTWHPMCPFCGSLGWIKRLLELIQVKVGLQNVLEQVRAPPLSPPYLYWLLILFFCAFRRYGRVEQFTDKLSWCSQCRIIFWKVSQKYPNMYVLCTYDIYHIYIEEGWGDRQGVRSYSFVVV